MLPVPPMPPMPFLPFGSVWGGKASQEKGKEEDSTKKDNFKSMLKAFLMQSIDIQKSSVENGRNQWNQFFDYMMELQDTFSASAPEEDASLPCTQMFAISPKFFMQWMKDFQVMANEHFMEQADSLADFFIQGQQQFYDMVSSAMESTETKKEAEAEADDRGQKDGE